MDLSAKSKLLAGEAVWGFSAGWTEKAHSRWRGKVVSGRPPALLL